VNNTYQAAPALTGSYSSDSAVVNRVSSGDITLDTGFSGAGPVWIQARRLSNFAVGPFALLLNPNGGNVGIGTTSPGTKLDVAGGITATSLNGTCISDSVNTASSTIAASSAAVKTAYDLSGAPIRGDFSGMYYFEVPLAGFGTFPISTESTYKYAEIQIQIQCSEAGRQVYIHGFGQYGQYGGYMNPLEPYTWVNLGGTGSGAHARLIPNSETYNVAGTYGAVVRIYSGQGSAANRYHYTFESVGCYGGGGSSITVQGKGYVIPSSYATYMTSMRVVTNGGSISGSWRVVKYV
jgi:hypothetical protein